MKKFLVTVAVASTASLGLWLGLGNSAAFANGAQAQTRQTVHVVAHTKSAVDTDNIQQGDQTTPDTNAESTDSSGSNDGTGDGTNDGTGGHQDPAGDVNHECTGDCQE